MGNRINKSANIILSVIFPLAILVSCYNNNNQRISEKILNTDSTESNLQTLNEPEKVVLKFYQWYLKSIYLKEHVEVPEVILTKDSIYKIDATKHLDFLKECGYFSSEFYGNETPLFNRCDEQLRKVNSMQVEESGGFAADFVENNDCSFLNWMVWTGGQGEDLSTVEIEKSIISADSATVIAVIGDATGYKYSNPLVTLLKEKGEWKISRIVITYPERNN